MLCASEGEPGAEVSSDLLPPPSCEFRRPLTEVFLARRARKSRVNYSYNLATSLEVESGAEYARSR